MIALVPAPGQTLSIRPFGDGDEAAVLALWQNEGIVGPGNDPAADIAFCRRSGHGELLVGLLGEQVVATVMAGHDGHRGWVYYLVTASDQRRRGFARRMMRHAEAWLGERGVPKLNLQIRQGNAAAQGFYERLGYAVEPRISMARRLAVNPKTLDMVITYLEMTAPPRLPPPPAPALKLAIMRIEQPTVPFYRFLYNSVGEPWLWYERRKMSDEALAGIIGDPKTDLYVIYVGGQPAGYGEIDKGQMPEIEIAYFGLMPGFIGLRLGPYFLRALVDTAWLASPRRVWVHTCNFDHPKALALYQRLGFQPYRQERKTIADPRPLA